MCDVFSSCINSGRQDDPVLWLFKKYFFDINQEKWINQVEVLADSWGAKFMSSSPPAVGSQEGPYLVVLIDVRITAGILLGIPVSISLQKSQACESL